MWTPTVRGLFAAAILNILLSGAAAAGGAPDDARGLVVQFSERRTEAAPARMPKALTEQELDSVYVPAPLAAARARAGLVRAQALCLAIPGEPGRADVSSLWALEFKKDADLAKLRAAWAADPAVEYVEYDRPGAYAYAPGDPLYAQTKPDFDVIGLEDAWDAQQGANLAVKVAVVDSGVDALHPDLAGVIAAEDSWNFADGDDTVYDDLGHGTRVAGIIAAEANNGEGIAGVAFGCRIMALDVGRPDGTIYSSDVASAIGWATSHGADVINLSLTFSFKSNAVEAACMSAEASDVLVVAAAGNENQGVKAVYPAVFESVLGVGAVLEDGVTRAPFSNFNGDRDDLVDLAAPGLTIYSTIPGGGYNGLSGSGTSFAAPTVSGVAALVRARHPFVAVQALRGHLADTAQPLGNWAGAGLVNAGAAVSTDILPDLRIVDVMVEDDPGADPDNNGDGRLQAGETVSISVVLSNARGAATGVSGVLSTTSSLVAIGDADAGWNDLSTGQILPSANAFTGVAVDPASDAGPISFRLNLAANSSAYTRILDFTVEIEALYEVPGDVSTDTTWTSDRTYVINGPTAVLPGARLTIQAGTIVRFASTASLNVQGEILAGTLGARRVLFTSLSGMAPVLPLPRYGGLHVEAGATAAAFRNCVVQFAPLVDESAVGQFIDCTFDRTMGDTSLSTPNGSAMVVRCTATGNAAGDGIAAGAKTLNSCTAEENAGVGLRGGQFIECRADGNGEHGMVGASASLCSASGNTSNGLLLTGSADSCTAVGNGAVGVEAGSAITDCRSTLNRVGFVADQVQDSTASYNSGDGIRAVSSVQGCTATGNHDVGVVAQLIVDSFVGANGRGVDLTGGGQVQRSRITQNNGDGVLFGQVLSSVVDANRGSGVNASEAVDNSWIVRNRGVGGLQVLDSTSSAFIANGSTGLQVPGTVENCVIERNAGVGVQGATPLFAAGLPSTLILGSTVRENRLSGVVSCDVSSSNLYDNARLSGYDYLEIREIDDGLQIVSAKPVYWGFLASYWPAFDPVTSRTFNASTIYDHIDDPALYLVDYGNPAALTVPYPINYPDDTPPPFLRAVAVDQGVPREEGDPVGVGPTTFTLTFSQPMDTSADPLVTFGYAAPYDDHLVRSVGWSDPRTWVGRFMITEETGDGEQTLVVSEARDVSGREAGRDAGNTFVITMTGEFSANNGLVSALGDTQLLVQWSNTGAPAGTQGYNLRRSATGAPGSYQKVNDAPIVSRNAKGAPAGQSTLDYLDEPLNAATLYFYIVDLIDAEDNTVQWTAPFFGVTTGSPGATPTPTPEPTSTPTPTPTPTSTPAPTPTPTAAPTPTPAPTATPAPTPTPGIRDIRDLIVAFYERILNRTPDAGEVDAWETGYFDYAVAFDIDVRFVPREMARLFFLSEEYAARGRTNSEFITDCYRTFLSRQPTTEELVTWLDGAWNRAQVMTLFAESAEFADFIVDMYPGQEGDSTRNFVSVMYVGLLDRLVDGGGLAYWADLFENSTDVRQEAVDMAKGVVASDEFQSASPTEAEYVTRFYRAFLGRFPSDGETAYWSGEMTAGRETADSLIERFAASAEFAAIINTHFGS